MGGKEDSLSPRTTATENPLASRLGRVCPKARNLDNSHQKIHIRSSKRVCSFARADELHAHVMSILQAMRVWFMVQCF